MQLPIPIAWTRSGAVRLLDQTRLPDQERYLDLETVDGVAEAISSLRVRGAPLIGVDGRENRDTAFAQMRENLLRGLRDAWIGEAPPQRDCLEFTRHWWIS